jgi:hypothetical protein
MLYILRRCKTPLNSYYFLCLKKLGNLYFLLNKKKVFIVTSVCVRRKECSERVVCQKIHGG